MKKRKKEAASKVFWGHEAHGGYAKNTKFFLATLFFVDLVVLCGLCVCDLAWEEVTKATMLAQIHKGFSDFLILCVFVVLCGLCDLTRKWTRRTKGYT